MRFVDIHIDGFGVFVERNIGPFDDGLNIVLGENEAGKSTLLDFLRGVLYGFLDRRSPKNFHEPLRGGRHGGVITLLDENSGLWSIERYVGKAVTVTDPTGTRSAESSLKGILGHTDRRAFESIFAFGLDELAQAERLHEEGVRDLIFSAGVAGAGRSASLAIRHLDEERADIVRNSRTADQKNRLHQLARDRDDLTERLRIARHQSDSFARLQREIGDLDRAAATSFATFRSRERRIVELESLERAEISRQRRLELARNLETLVPLTEDRLRLARQTVKIEGLNIRLAGYAGAVAERTHLKVAATERDARMRSQRERIGLDEDVTPGEITVGTHSEIETLARAFEIAERERHAQKGTVERAAAALERQRAERLRLTGDHSPEDLDVADRRLQMIPALRSMLSTRRDEDHSAELVMQASRSTRPLRFEALFVTFGVLMLLGTGATAFGATKRGSIGPLAMVFGATVLLLGLIGLLILRRQRRSMRDHSLGHPDRTSETRDLRERIAERSSLLGLPELPTEGEVTELEERLRNEERTASSIRAALRAEDERASELAEGREMLDRVEEEIDELRARSRTICDELDLKHPVEPDVLPVIVHEISELNNWLAEELLDKTRLPEIEHLIAEFEGDLGACLHACGRDEFEPPSFKLGLDQLASEARLVCAEIAARDEIAAEIAKIDEIITALFDQFDEPMRLNSELEVGFVDARARELLELSSSLEGAKEEYERIVGERRDRENELAELQTSSSIVDLEIGLGTVEVDIETLLRRWVVLSAASTLLKNALNRYEVERQPAVIEQAGRLFAEVTGGRYSRLTAHEDDQHRSLRVIGQDGGSFEAQYLSKGAAEQLYLCVRLAYATTFAERSIALPLILDDVLVNFDPVRSEQMARAISSVATLHQVVLFTCHPNIVEIIRSIAPDTNVITI